MTERAYTVKEIDDLRKACDRRFYNGTTAHIPRAVWEESSPRIYCGRGMTGTDKQKIIEESVRTYMLAGITAEQIYESDNVEADRIIAERAPKEVEWLANKEVREKAEAEFVEENKPTWLDRLKIFGNP